MPLRFSAIAWDLDGTLADTADDLTASLNHLRRREGLSPLAVDEVRHLVGDGAKALVQRGLSPSDEPVGMGYVRDFLDHYRSHCCDCTRLMPGAREALARLDGLAHAVATNKPLEFTDPILRHLGIATRFAAVLGADSVPNKKPAPDMLMEIARRLNVRVESILMVGDSPNDIRAARAAGARVCAVTYGYKSREELSAEAPDWLIDRLDKLDAIVTG